MAKIIEASDPHAAWATMSMKMLANISLYGLLIGVVTFALYVGLERFVFDPILCRASDALARCENTKDFAGAFAIILGSIGGLVFLVRERVYRPILAILGVAISLWSVFVLVAGLPIILAGAMTAVLFAIAYVLFSWLVQPTSLVISIVGVIVVTTLVRLAVG